MKLRHNLGKKTKLPFEHKRKENSIDLTWEACGLIITLLLNNFATFGKPFIFFFFFLLTNLVALNDLDEELTKRDLFAVWIFYGEKHIIQVPTPHMAI